MRELVASLIGRSEADAEPDRSPKRFAPYTVWSKVRIVGALGFGLIGAGVLLPLPLQSLWPLVLLAPGFVIAPPVPGLIEQGAALTVELIGYFLGSRYCPACGQSIFDDGGPTGYLSDSERARWWPNRTCANCGHDLTQRVAK